MKQIELYQDKLPESDQALVDKIQEEANNAPPREKGLSIHLRAIETLRAKDYTYREIAEWFTERGLKVNHVDVWRAHKNGIEPTELFDIVKSDSEWEQYIEKSQAGNCVKYSEVEFDEDGNKKPKLKNVVKGEGRDGTERQPNTGRGRKNSNKKK